MMLLYYLEDKEVHITDCSPEQKLLIVQRGGCLNDEKLSQDMQWPYHMPHLPNRPSISREEDF